MGWLVSAAVLLTLLAGLCASAEAALARVSRVRVQDLVAQRRRGAQRLQEMLADAPRSLNVILLVSYIAVGVSPRTLGQQHADRVALGAAVVLYPLARVLGPITRVLISIGNAVTPGEGFRKGPFASEAE